MDTKLKNWVRNRYLKLAAYAVIILCVGASAYLFITSGNEDVKAESLCYKNYYDSNGFSNELNSYMKSLVYAELYYENESKIRSRAVLSEDTIAARKAEVYNQRYDDYNEITIESSSSDYEIAAATGTQEEAVSFEEYFKKYPEKEEKIKNNLVKEQLLEFKDYKRSLKKNEIFSYEVTEKKEEMEQWKKKYETYPFFLYITSDDINSNKDYIRHGLINSVSSFQNCNQNKAVFVGIDQAAYNRIQQEWENSRRKVEAIFQPILILLFISLTAILYLGIMTGRRSKEKGVHLYPVDSVYSEVQIFVLICTITACIYYTIVLMNGYIGYNFSDNFFARTDITFFKEGWIALIISSMLATLCVLLSQIRRLKARKFWDGFISIRILKKVFYIIKKVWEKSKISQRAIISAIILPLLCATWVGAPFVIAFLIYMIYKYMNDFVEICEGTKKVRNGDLNYQIIVKEEGELGELADDINKISQGLDKAVSNEIRSERLKAELISNVSHDLKTPLTSVVTYVDLLKKEKLDNDTAKEYIEVIDRKAKQLTELTNDLFEAAKASSGALPVELEKIDWNAIIRQGLGEFDEKLKTASLEMKVTLLEEPAYILADGKLIWRVFDNLLGNIIKYSLEHSRVYITLEEEESQIHFNIKNISAYELNISADELMERFKRGDESRNSEGSGLGLSIANSLIDLQHGSFKVSIDGDLFRVDIWMPRWTPQTHE